MSRLLRAGMLVAMFLGGMVGGMVSQQFFSLAASASPGNNDLEVKSIRIVDASGNLRGLFGMLDNKPQVKLLDSNGNTSLSVMTGDSGGMVILNGPQGKPAVILQTKGDNSSFLNFYKSTGGISLSAGLNNDQPFTAILDREAKPRIMLGNEGDNYMLKVYDQHKRIRCGLGVIDDEPQLLVLGSGGKSSAIVKVSSRDVPQIGAYDKNAIARSLLTVNDKVGSFLSLADENGKSKAMLSAGISGESYLALSSESGKVGLLAYGKKDVFGLGVFNGDGTDGFAIQTDANGSVLGFRDSQQKMRAVAGVRGDKPWIGVLDQGGAPVWGGPGPVPNLPPMGDLDAATRDLLR